MITKKISFTSAIFDGEETLTTAFEAEGTIQIDIEQQQIQIDFAEPTEDSLFLDTTLLIQEGQMQIYRIGHVSMAQEFIIGESVYGSYETEYGEFSTMSLTKTLEIDCTEDEGEIYLVYDFYLNDEKASVIQLTIEY